ncbi:hypothetical protein Dimus_032704, partial [Dionaea muscipula]
MAKVVSRKTGKQPVDPFASKCELQPKQGGVLGTDQCNQFGVLMCGDRAGDEARFGGIPLIEDGGLRDTNVPPDKPTYDSRNME